MGNYISGKGLGTTEFRKKYPFLYEEDEGLIYVADLETRRDVWGDLTDPATSFLTGGHFFGLDKNLIPADWVAISKNLKQLGDNERIKEKKVLEKMLAIEGLEDKEYTGKQYIDMINMAFNTKKLYDEAMAKIGEYNKLTEEQKEAYQKDYQQAWKNNTSVKQAEKELEKIVTPVLNNTLRRYEAALTEAAAQGHSDFQKVWDKFAEAFEKALSASSKFDNFIQTYLTNDEVNTEGLDEIQTKLATADLNAQAFKKSFAASVMQQFFAGRASEKVEKEIKKGISKQQFTKTVRPIIFSTSEDSSKTSSKSSKSKPVTSLMTGLSEILGGAISAAITNGSVGGNLTFKAIQQGLAQGNIDSSLFNANIVQLAQGTIDFGIPAGKKDSSVKKFVRDRLKEIETRYSQVASDLAKSEDAVAVYESTKLYQVNSISNEKRWFSGTTYKFEAARSLIEELGSESSLSIDNVDLFFHRLLNEAPGGLSTIVNQRAADEEALKKIIANNIAAFLFDDYWNIGQEAAGTHGVTAIHLFRLTHIVVPLSSFLLLIARSLEEAVNELALGDTVKINLTLPKIQLGKGETIEESWRRTREIAENNFNLKINFLRNFQEGFNKWI